MGFTQPAMAQDIWAVALSGNGKLSAPDKCSLCSASDSPAMGESLPAASGMNALAEMGMESVRFSALDSV